MAYNPTNQQQAVIQCNHRHAYVRACPGAGKTRTIVSRIKDKNFLASPRKGVAVVSFTNSAVTEFKEKCIEAEISYEFNFPNFVGTFDSFIWRFIALPLLQTLEDINPRLMESWSDIYINLRGNQRINGQGIPLSKFNPINRTIDVGGLRPNVTRVVEQNMQAYIAEAERRVNALTNKGYYSTSDVRAFIHQALDNNENMAILGEVIASRFHEVIVDEAQDCNDVDLSILAWLQASNVPLKIICDPSQTIYEFRDANPQQLETFVREINTYPLEGNFRSSPDICDFSALLRENHQPDDALGALRNYQEVIRIFPYDGQTVCATTGERFCQIAERIGIPRSGLISLAHDRSSAMRAIGIAPPSQNQSTSKRFRLADAVSKYKNKGVDNRQTDRALLSVVKLILEAKNLLQRGMTLQECLNENEIEEREIRRIALQVISDLPGHCVQENADDWIDKAKSEFLKYVTLPAGTTINQLFRTSDGWSEPLITTEINLQVLPHATIHEAKGSEFDGVLLSIKPRSDVVENWRNGNYGEDVRVLYVGATRAKKLLCIGVPRNKVANVQEILNDGQVNHEIL